MSILIKGMGMPRHCEDCPFLEISGDYPYCVATGTQKGYTFIPKLRTERMDSCPLVEIPPHGRLIDADDFSRRLWEGIKDEHNQKAQPNSWADALQDFDFWLESLDTIIEAEGVKE